MTYAGTKKAMLKHQRRFNRKYVMNRRSKMKMMPIAKAVIAFCAALILVGLCIGLARAQESVDLVPRWSYGVTAAFTAIRQEGGVYHNEFLTGGAGPQINFALVDAANFPWIGIGNPWLMRGNSGDDLFALSPGLTLTIIGNLTFGAAYDLIKTEKGVGTGLMTGQSSWEENGTLLFGVQLPIGANTGVWTMGR